jgi:hypothetical protein
VFLICIRDRAPEADRRSPRTKEVLMSRGRQPKDFAPGAELGSVDSKLLEKVGFERGCPIFGTRTGEQASDLQKIIHALTFPANSGEGYPPRNRPIVRQSALIPDGSGSSTVVRTPMEVREIRRAWSGEEPYWYLAGRLADRPDDEKWYIDRKLVGVCRMHLLFWLYTGYVQLVPISLTSGRPMTTCASEGFQWGELSSQGLPPQAPG